MGIKINDFINFESRLSLWNRMIFNQNYWHLVRFGLFHILSGAQSDINFNYNQLQLEFNYKKILRIFHIIISLFSLKYYFKTGYKDVLIVTGGGRVQVNNYYVNPKFDFFINDLDLDFLYLEQLFHHKNYGSIPTKNVIYLRNFQVKKRLYSYYFSIFHRNNKNLILESKLISKLLYDEFNYKIKAKIIKKIMITHISDYIYSNKFYRKLLKATKPKIILLTVSYSTHKMALINIAKSLKIPTVEMQHGVMGQYHIAYNFKNYSGSTFPDYIFTFGKYWSEYSRVPIKKENVVSTGYPFQEARFNDYNKSRKIYNKTILFISSYRVGKKLSELAIKLKEEFKEYNFIYKLHPEEFLVWKKEYPSLMKSGIDIVDSNVNDIHYYLSQANFIIGVSSTVMFEGLPYDLISIIYDIEGSEYLDYLADNYFAYKSNKYDTIVSIIKDSKKLSYDSNFFWARNAKKNVLKSINDIIEKNI